MQVIEILVVLLDLKRKGSSHLKHNSLNSTIRWLTPTRALSPSHTSTHPWHPCGSCPPQPVSLLGPAPTLSPSFRLAQAIFEPNLFLYKYPNILNPSHSSYLPAYEGGPGSVVGIATGYGLDGPGIEFR